MSKNKLLAAFVSPRQSGGEKLPYCFLRMPVLLEGLEVPNIKSLASPCPEVGLM
jgi:hypothetical protein